MQPSAIYFKDPTLKKKASFSTVLSARQDYIDERKNWDYVRLPGSALDSQGSKITYCPQDPSMVKKVLSVYEAAIDVNSVFFASGEATGWASKAFIGTGHSVLITFYIVRR